MTILAGVTLLAFTIASVAGFGGGLILMPMLVWMLGPREAIPIITLVQVVGAVSRVGLNWKEISWPVLKWSALGSIPISALASYLFVVTPAPIFTRLLGLLLLVLVAQRHTQWGRGRSIKLRSFVLVGGANGLASGYLGTPGPLAAPFHLAYGLTGAAFVGTTAAGVLLTQLPKIPVFASNALLGTQVLYIAAAMGVMAFAGSVVGKRISGKVSDRWFLIGVETLLVLSGIALIVQG
tara:strand:- start:184 stop:894 length:711 start_codon:yes stop_codon:yes gene_type:complete